MKKFPSPYGAWVVTKKKKKNKDNSPVSVPLRGMGCDMLQTLSVAESVGFRPLTGHGL